MANNCSKFYRNNFNESCILYNMQRYKFLRKEKIIKENVYECEKFKSLSFLLVLLILFSTVPAYALDYSMFL